MFDYVYREEMKVLLTLVTVGSITGSRYLTVDDLDSFEFMLPGDDLDSPWSLPAGTDRDTTDRIPPRAFIINCMRENIQMKLSEMAVRMWTSSGVSSWLLEEEISAIRYEVALPLVQRVDFHNLLKSYVGERFPWNAEFINHVMNGLPLNSEFRSDPARLIRAIEVWGTYCLAPLEVWEILEPFYGAANMPAPPCAKKEIIENGVRRVAFVLGKDMIRDYLDYEFTTALSSKKPIV
jgi:hypothetical protein